MIIMATADSVKAKLQGLIDKSNATTGNTDADLTTAVDALISQVKNGLKLNIAYGDTPPEDTTKLWVKTSKPSKVIVDSDIRKQIGADSELSLFAEAVFKNQREFTTSYPVVGTKMYLMQFANSTKMATFDLETKEYVTLNSVMPFNGNSSYIQAVGDKIFVLNGTTSSTYNMCYCYDTVADKMVLVGNMMPFTVDNIKGVAVGTVGTKIYFFGGSKSNHDKAGMKDTIYRFDTETSTIQLLTTPLPIPLAFSAIAVVGTKIYLFGGDKGSYTGTKAIYCFDTETEEIRELTNTLLPTAIYNQRTGVIDGRVYLFGSNQKDATTQNIYQFDPASELLFKIEISFPILCYAPIVTSYNNAIYINSAEDGSFNVSLDVYKFVYSIVPFLYKGDLQIVPVVGTNEFLLINDDTALFKIGAKNVFVGNENNLPEIAEAALYKNGAWTTI
jgi:hypothetical protein